MLVSVIIPAFNRASVLPRALQSVLTQTYEDYEILIVDDASTDDTSDLVKSYTDSRIIYLRHAANRGGAASRNTGIERARGELVAFLDSDDQWEPNKLQRQIDVLQRAGQDCGVVYTALKAVYEATGETEMLEVTHRGRFLHELLISNCVRTLSSVIVRRSALLKAGGFDPQLRSCQDWDLYIRLAKECSFECINEPLTVYYVNKKDPSRISNARKSIVQGHEAVARKYQADYQGLSKSERLRYNESVSDMFILGGNISHPFRLMLQAFRLTGDARYLGKAVRYSARYIKSKFRSTHGY
ncbi:MAG: glycosyltransferase family 2 protein [Candidatus Omnitrophica bacterium]|nr:glycosyltransferase family 2 protein [Candidatus Omnitrophota bacterium]